MMIYFNKSIFEELPLEEQTLLWRERIEHLKSEALKLNEPDFLKDFIKLYFDSINFYFEYLELNDDEKFKMPISFREEFYKSVIIKCSAAIENIILCYASDRLSKKFPSNRDSNFSDFYPHEINKLSDEKKINLKKSADEFLFASINSLLPVYGSNPTKDKIEKSLEIIHPIYKENFNGLCLSLNLSDKYFSNLVKLRNSFSHSHVSSAININLKNVFDYIYLVIEVFRIIKKLNLIGIENNTDSISLNKITESSFYNSKLFIITDSLIITEQKDTYERYLSDFGGRVRTRLKESGIDTFFIDRSNLKLFFEDGISKNHSGIHNACKLYSLTSQISHYDSDEIEEYITETKFLSGFDFFDFISNHQIKRLYYECGIEGEGEMAEKILFISENSSLTLNERIFKSFLGGFGNQYSNLEIKIIDISNHSVNEALKDEKNALIVYPTLVPNSIMWEIDTLRKEQFLNNFSYIPPLLSKSANSKKLAEILVNKFKDI